jgi:hypothetical protein
VSQREPKILNGDIDLSGVSAQQLNIISDAVVDPIVGDCPPFLLRDQAMTRFAEQSPSQARISYHAALKGTLRHGFAAD